MKHKILVFSISVLVAVFTEPAPLLLMDLPSFEILKYFDYILIALDGGYFQPRGSSSFAPTVLLLVAQYLLLMFGWFVIV